MPLAPEDPVQSRVAQLEAIAARRNELLVQMYQLMRQRHGIGTATDESDDEGEALQSFLDKFDLCAMGEHGLIKNHVQRLLWPDNPTSGVLEDPDLDSLVERQTHSPKSHQPSEEKKERYGAREKGDENKDDRNKLDLIGDPAFKNAPNEMLKGATDNGVITGDDEAKEQTGAETIDNNEAMDIDPGPSSLAINEHLSSRKGSPAPSSHNAQDLPPAPSFTQNTTEQCRSPERDSVAHPDHSRTGPFAATVLVSRSNAVLSHVTNASGGERSTSWQEPTSQAQSPPERVPLKATPADTGISPSLLVGHKSPITIPTPLEPSLSVDHYSDAVTPLPDKPLPSASLNPQDTNVQKIDYTLPDLQILPPEFSRKKTSKRKKDRSDKKGGDDLPMGLNRWAATLNANPVYTRLKRSTKCLSTKEWSLAIAELRLMRTVERIEKLKLEGRWGFRQTKKQRGLGGLLKTHWDYLMDEMKWMRTDFREERKWKLALAYNLSTSVLEWHALDSWEERVAHGICVKWKPILEGERGNNDAEVDPGQGFLEPEGAEEPEEGRHASLLAVDYTSDDDDMEVEDVDSKDVINPLDSTTEIQDAIEGASETRELESAKAASAEDVAADVQPKKEDVDDATSALHGIMGEGDLTIGKAEQPVVQDVENLGLKPTSKDPILGSKSSSHSLNGDADEGKSNNSKVKINAYTPMREKIVYGSSDKLFIGPEDLDFFAASDKSDKAEQSLSHALGLNTLFPELQPFSMLDVAPAVTEPTKKKSSRSADKDDPNKRIEEANYTKVMPSGKFMNLKPTLLGPLQPSKRWKDGKWLSMEEYAIPADLDSSNRITEESLCDLFEFKVKPPGKGDGPQAKDARQPRSDQYWSLNDDLLLKSLIDRYPGNWNLIAECFNGARLTTPSDRRSPTDCQDRWRAKWGIDLQAKSQLAQESAPGDDQTSGSNENGGDSTVATSISATSVAASSMTTRGVKRLASASISSQQAPPVPGAGSEPKKRRRHFLIQETIRRVSKKRQDHAQKMLANQRKQPGMHDTHVQLHKLAKVTPAELSRQKQEREAAQLAEIQKARARQEELNGKNVPRLAGIPVPPQAAAALAAQAAQQQQQQQPTQPPQQQTPQITQQQLQQHQLLLQAQAQAQAQATQAQAQAQASQANRAASNGTAAVANASRQGNVNIARISTPNIPTGNPGAPRLTPQQLLQLQQQQQRTLSQQMGNGAVNGGGPVNSSGLNRDFTASPSHGATNVGVNSPSPANVAQAQQQVQAAGARPAGNHYFMNAGGPPYSAEQINGIRMMMLQQQHAQQLQQQQQQQNQGN